MRKNRREALPMEYRVWLCKAVQHQGRYTQESRLGAIWESQYETL